MKTREELQQWALSLSPGDEVVWHSWYDRSNRLMRVLTVKKVTPTGIVRTDDGDYKLNKWSGEVSGVGSTSGYISPAEGADHSEAKANMARIKEDYRRMVFVRRVKSVLSGLAGGTTPLSYEMAVELARVIDECAVTNK